MTWISQRKHDVSDTNDRSQSISRFTSRSFFCSVTDIDDVDPFQWRYDSDYFGRSAKLIGHFAMRYGDDHVSVFRNNYHSSSGRSLTKPKQKASRLESCAFQCICSNCRIYCFPTNAMVYTTSAWFSTGHHRMTRSIRALI